MADDEPNLTTLRFDFRVFPLLDSLKLLVCYRALFFCTEKPTICRKSLGIYLKSCYYLDEVWLTISLINDEVYWLLYELLRLSTDQDEYLK